MNIWQLDPANLTPYYNLALCESLAKAGQQVHYITTQSLYDKELPTSGGYSVENVYFRGLNHPWLLRFPRLRKSLRGLWYPLDHRLVLHKMRQAPPDVVHIQWSRLPRFDRYLIKNIKDLDIPIVHTVHNIKSSFATPGMISQLGAVYQQVDRLFLHTAANQRDFLALYPQIPAEKSIIIPHIDIPYQHPIGQNSSEQLKRAFGIEESAFVFLFFGRILQYKGLAVLLDAFEQVLKADDTVYLLIAGKAESAQDSSDVSRAYHMKNVLVHEGFIPTEALWKYFAAADLAVFPYRNIAQSGALIQAMSFGKPVIATDVGGFPETINGNGWIVPKDDPKALAEVMLMAMQNKIDLRQKGKRSRELIDQYHDGQAVAQQHIQVYQKLL